MIVFWSLFTIRIVQCEHGLGGECAVIPEETVSEGAAITYSVMSAYATKITSNPRGSEMPAGIPLRE